MTIEEVVFGSFVAVVIVAMFIGVGRRQKRPNKAHPPADDRSDNSVSPSLYLGHMGGSSSATGGTHGPTHSSFGSSSEAGGGSHGGGSDAASGSHEAGNPDAGGGFDAGGGGFDAGGGSDGGGGSSD